MPQMTQIVPQWKHPHEMVVINNNTWFLDATAEQTTYNTRAIFPILAGKGEDRKILSFTQANNFLEEFGNGDFKLYGQPYFNGYQFLRNNTDVLGYFIRVTAPDATFSHVVILAKVKAVPGTPEDTANNVAATPGSMEIYYEAQYLDGATDLDVMTSRIHAMREDTTPDADGYLTFPVALVYSRGRGAYGDNIRFRITKETNLDLENDFLNYRVDVYEMEEYLKLKNSVKGSIYEGAVQDATAVFFEDINNDIEVGGKVKFMTFQDNLEDIYNLYIDTVNPNVVVPYEQFDFFFGLIKEELDPIEGLTINNTANDNAIVFDGAEGVTLSGGSDGIFGRARTEAEKIVREAAIEDELIKTFRGEYDKGILSKRRTPQEVFFDANYPEAVKYEIITWLTSRGDGYGHLDAGILSTLTDAITWGERFYNLGDRLYGKSFQSYEVIDPFTSKKIRVTYPYFLAMNLPTHFNTAGNHQPFAAGRAYLNGHVKNSVMPDLDGDDSETKEVLYELRLNYLETLAENVYYRGTQSTSDIGETKRHWSDLNEENNMYVLLEYKRMLENFCREQRYEFSEPEDRARFTRLASDMFVNDIGVKVRSVDVYFDMNPWEEERSILHCYLAVVFRTITKRSIIEIDVNSRV